MPKSKQSNIKTRVARRKPHDDPALDSKQKATFLSKDNKKQPVHTPPSDSSVSSTIAKDKKNTENMLASLVPPRHIEVHQEGRTTVDKKLRAFDLDYKYGPCVGLSRLQRWERAQTLGLDPPPDIKSLLLDRSNKDYQECLFKGAVI